MKYLKLTVLLFLALAIASRATDCGDGSDGSVANCCYAYQGSCDSCAIGYGLSTDKTQCNKCKSSTCADCPGNPAVCKTQINTKPIPNCSYGDDNNQQCFDCDDGYVPTADSKACVKCTAPNCSNCNPAKPAVCSGCSYGYSLVNGQCIKCIPLNCDSCNGNVCTQCAIGYGLAKGQCTRCPPNSFSCDNSKLQCNIGYGIFGAKAGTCKQCIKNCSVCNKSVCDKCADGYGSYGGAGTCKQCPSSGGKPCNACNKTSCDLCYYYKPPVNGVCRCYDNSLPVNGVCPPL